MWKSGFLYSEIRNCQHYAIHPFHEIPGFLILVYLVSFLGGLHMKKHLSKRLLSLFLAVMMVITSAPFVASAAEGYNGDDIRYLFAYFTGNDGEEQVRFAVSEDGLNFEALNGNAPVLSNDTKGQVYPSYAAGMGMAASGCARDPFVIQKHDGNGYYIVATDLNINQSSYRNSKLLVWDVDDLGNAGDVTPWNIETSAWFYNYAGNGDINGYPDFYAWAPGVVYVPDRDMYLLYWSAGRAGDPRNAFNVSNSNYDTFGIYGVYTKDFKTFYDETGAEMTADSDAVLLYNPSDYASIDADIVYNEADKTYYMWHKNEKNESEQIASLDLATAKSSNGEYSRVKTFSDSDYTGDRRAMEGPFTYQLSDGRYVLMADWYGEGYENAEFVSYVSSDPSNFEHNSIANTVNINYLRPRHGKVCQIKANEYQDLIENYGKVTYSGQNYFGSGSVNDTLIARYFINDNLNYDNTGNGYTLTSNQLEVQYDNTRTWAHFNGNGNSQNLAGSYARVDLAQMVNQKGIDASTGLTLSWYARNTSTSSERFVEVSTVDPGSMTTSTPAQFVYYNNENKMEIQYSDYYGRIETEAGTRTDNNWHLYTMTISSGFVSVSIDGVVHSFSVIDGRTGGPVYCSQFNKDVVNALFQGDLFFGASSWENDLFSGDMYDFRIYNRALSNNEIQDSLNELGSASYIGDSLTSADTSHRVFYDPMETVDSYTAYDQTYNDASMGNVLQLNGTAIKAHDTYTASDSENGYTISFWYNPGDSLDGVMLNIGQHATSEDNANKKYFTLEETGELWYCYNTGDAGSQSYGDIKNIFGSTGLTVNEWQHIVIQIVPNGNYEILYVYIDGQLVNKFESYKSVDNSGNRTMKDNRTMLNFFEKENLDVWYGTGYLDSYNWGNANGLIDDVTIFNDSYNALDVYEQNAISHATTLLDTAMQRYLDKMSNIQSSSTIYTNMEPAYSAYNRARRYIDSVEKGEVNGGVRDNAYCAELFVDLVAATNAMEPYNKPADIGGMNSTESGVATAVDPAYTNNMLSTVNISRPMEWKGGTMLDDDTYATDNGGQNMSLATGSFVWMYTGIDGDTPTAPINAGFYVNNFATFASYFVHYLYPTSGDISLQSDWQFSDSSTVDWYYPNGGRYTVSTNPNVAYGDCLEMSTDGKWFYGSNQMNYTGDESDFTNNNTASDYYIEFQPTFTGCIHTEWWDWGTKNQHNTPNDPDNPNSAFWPQGSIYVFNFAKVRAALLDSTRISILTNVQNYTPDSVSALLKAYDTITSQEYRFNSASEEAVSALATVVDQQVKDLEKVDVQNIESFADGSELETVRDNETSFHDSIEILPNGDAVIPEGQENAGEIYTASSWTAYDKAYDAVREYYAGLDPYGDDEQYATRQAQLDTLVDNINNAKAHLVARADYTPVNVIFDTENDNYDGKYTEKIAQTNGTSSDDQTYTYGTWKSFEDSYNSAEDWFNKSDSYKADTEKYDTDYQISELGPYVGIDANGNVVTEPNADPDTIEWYMYVGDFYDNPTDSEPSQFETGDYIKIDGEIIQLNGNRYAPETINRPTLSVRQNQINTDGANVVTSYDDLTPVADYTTYNATTDLLKYQDVAAFNDANSSTVFSTLKEQGIQDGSYTYSNGADDTKSVSVDTPEYVNGSESTAYVEANNTVWKNQGSQSSLDGMTQSVLEALESVNNDATAERAKFDVNFSYFVGDTQTPVQVGTDNTLYYGESYVATVPEGLYVYKWVVNANGTTMEIPASQEYTAYITSDITIVAYCSETPVESDVTVKVLNQYQHQIEEYVISADTQITIGDKSYQIGDTSQVDLIDPPFYTFTGWKINGTDYSYSTYTASDIANEDGEIVLRPLYAVTSGMYELTMTGGSIAGANYNEDSNTYLAPYDTHLTVTPDSGSYGIAIKIGDKYYAVSYGEQSYSFFVANSVDLYAITDNGDGTFSINGSVVDDEVTVQKLQRKLPFSYSLGNSEEAIGKFTALSATTAVPSGATVTEVGTIFTRDAAIAADPSQFVIGTDGVTAVAAKNQLATMQYGIRFNVADGSTVYARSYVKYKYTTGNVSSEDGSTVNQGTTIQTVDYGNVVSSN